MRRGEAKREEDGGGGRGTGARSVGVERFLLAPSGRRGGERAPPPQTLDSEKKGGKGEITGTFLKYIFTN